MATGLDELAAELRRAAMVGGERFDRGVLEVAQRIEAKMAANVREGGVHPYGTPTTARKGGGPAVISGDLARAITHQKVDGGYRIGPAAVPHTQYASRRKGRSTGGKVTSGQIGEYVEKMGYPFVQPSLDAISGEITDIIRAQFVEEL